MSKTIERSVLSLIARTLTVTATDLKVPIGTWAFELEIYVSAISATPQVTPTILTSNGLIVLTGAVITGTGTTFLRYGVGTPNVANVAQAGIPHQGMTLTMSHGDADSITYSVKIRAIQD